VSHKSSPPVVEVYSKRDEKEQEEERKRVAQSFFKIAKKRLTYDDYTKFLTTVKDYNSHNLTKAQALASARQIFGPQNADLLR